MTLTDDSDAEHTVHGVGIEGIRLGDCIGAGKSGRVFEAWDAATGRALAVKIELQLAPDRASQLSVERRAYSALEACAAVPRMVGYHDGPADAPFPQARFLVLERAPVELAQAVMRSGSVRNSIRCAPSSHPLTWSRHCTLADSAWLLARLLGTLQELHTAGVLHRDLKPQNIVLRRRARAGIETQLIDLGLAKRYVERDAQGTWQHIPLGRQTFLGTPLYVSPHIHAGRTASRRDDVWSACIVALVCAGVPLPWLLAKSFQHIPPQATPQDNERARRRHMGALKADVAAWTADLPPSLCRVCLEAHALAFDEAPPYAAWQTALEAALPSDYVPHVFEQAVRRSAAAM